MKQFKLLWMELRALLLARPRLAAVLLLGITASFYTFGLMYGSAEYSVKALRNHASYNTYTVDFGDGAADADIETLRDIFATHELTTAFFMTIHADEPLILGWKGRNGNYWFVQTEGDFLSAAQVASGERVAVITEAMYPYPDVNYRNYDYILDGAAYRVVGLSGCYGNVAFFAGDSASREKYYPTLPKTPNVASHDGEQEEAASPRLPDMRLDAVIIPYTAYLDAGYRPTAARLQYALTGEAMRTEVLAALTAQFPGAAVTAPPPMDYSSVMTGDALAGLVKAALAAAASLVNIVALYIFWLKTRVPVYRICKRVGCTAARLFCIVAAQWAALICVCFFASRLLVRLTAPALNRLEFYIWDSLTAAQSAAVVCGGFAVTLALFAPRLFREVRT